MIPGAPFNSHSPWLSAHKPKMLLCSSSCRARLQVIQVFRNVPCRILVPSAPFISFVFIIFLELARKKQLPLFTAAFTYFTQKDKRPSPFEQWSQTEQRFLSVDSLVVLALFLSPLGHSSSLLYKCLECSAVLSTFLLLFAFCFSLSISQNLFQVRQLYKMVWDLNDTFLLICDLPVLSVRSLFFSFE